ncbi:HAMP domain-containing sensor histidine kinase [Bacillus cereus group sp. BfR-BA-01380]|uniref:HAMP domain-containing sensor histidine kinase n=1 Tax=Bacillus cereus group sp. BfR-BA-01380 TaxID=2920324 RepID=UPI001F59120A|nr:HAMP domain-containing sensor histidine kinase [Bacillus cereus group sp. BfR-BA-01380]
MKLSTKYIIVILLSILFFPISYFGVNFSYYVFVNVLGSFSNEEFISEEQMKQRWEENLMGLESKNSNEIIRKFEGFGRFSGQRIYWISDTGDIIYTTEENVDKTWSAMDIIDFIQNNEKDNSYNYFSYLRGADKSGYVILQVPHENIGTKWEVLKGRYSSFWYLFLLTIWGLFVYITWLFFRKISNRLIKMQKHMEKNKDKLIPSKMVVSKKDEIGDLEESFNFMVDDLNRSYEKEEKEKLIRKKLIASLSHDLKTPLSIIRGHAHKLQDLKQEQEGKESIEVIINKVAFLGELIDNLSSYTVLSEGRLPINIASTNVIPIIRKSLIDWYPLFEELEFEIDIDLSHSFKWDIDEIWMLRILNNLFQNVKRHACQGKYLKVETGKKDGREFIAIIDHGPGFENSSTNQGEGIGLSIVYLMIEQMNLNIEVTDLEHGTSILIYKYK